MPPSPVAAAQPPGISPRSVHQDGRPRANRRASTQGGPALRSAAGQSAEKSAAKSASPKRDAWQPQAKASAAAPKGLAPTRLREVRQRAPAVAAQLRHYAGGFAKAFGKLACGLGVVAGLGYAFAAIGATEMLLRVLSGASILDRVASNVPFIGPLLAVLMGVGGNYGFAGVGLILFNVVDARFGVADGWNASLRWLRAHAAIAFALSPLWLPTATSLSFPVMTGLAVGVGYLSWTVTRPQENAPPPSFGHTLFALGVALGLSPVGAQAASGVSGLNIIRQAVNFPLLAFGSNAVVSAGRHLSTLFSSGTGVQTGAGRLMSTGNARLYTGPETQDPTVFIDPLAVQGFLDAVEINTADAALGLNNGPRCVLLRAPSGAGKRAVACALTNALKSRMYEVDRDAFEAVGKGHSGQALAARLDQWGEEAESLGRPVLIYVPEILQLAPKVLQGQTAGTSKSDRGAKAEKDPFSSQLKTLLANESGGKAPNLLFVLATTHSAQEVEAQVEGPVRNRITKRLTWSVPNAEQLQQIWQYKVARALRASVVHPEIYEPVLQEQLAAILAESVGNAERLAQSIRQGMTGADVDVCVAEAVDEVATHYLRRRPRALAPDEPDHNFPLRDELVAQLCTVFDSRSGDADGAGEAGDARTDAQAASAEPRA